MHEIIVEQAGRITPVKVAHQGKGCPFCASTAEDRARITFVKATR